MGIRSCPNPLHLRALALGRGGVPDEDSVRQHVAECVACRTVVAGYADTDEPQRTIVMEEDGSRRADRPAAPEGSQQTVVIDEDAPRAAPARSGG